uniref:Putative secreted protein n=1 Tax=Anopheles darlingi TaxID=43151 RepID=A0A2M4D2N7_ANODA
MPADVGASSSAVLWVAGGAGTDSWNCCCCCCWSWSSWLRAEATCTCRGWFGRSRVVPPRCIRSVSCNSPDAISTCLVPSLSDRVWMAAAR